MSDLSHDEMKMRVWRVCRVLAFITAFEITAALLYYYGVLPFSKIWLDILYAILSVLKAYYIMSEFMHLKYELKPMTITILTPFLFLVWGIIAFIWEGSYWLSARELWNSHF